MSNQFYIPACHKFIKTKDGEPNAQRIFSVAKTAFKQKNPNTILDDEQLLQYLTMNGLIDETTNKEDIDLNQIEMCFSIITQYKCNAICQLCGYSPLYKNQLENQEAVLLGYSLSSWNNLQLLLHSGVTCRLFRAMIPVSEKSAVSVVPLNRLAFEYMEKVPKRQEDMLSIADKIVASIKQNNKDKLSASDFKIVHRYLNNLYNSNFRYLKNEDIGRCLKHFNLELKEPTVESVATPEPTKPDAIPVVQECLPVQIPQQESIGKKKEKEKETPEVDVHIEKMHVWKLSETDLQYAPFQNLEHANTQQMYLFKEYLLVTPLLPMELVRTDQRDIIVFFAGDKLYYYTATNPIILDEFLPYINKSRFRKVLCYEPYFLHAYFNEQQIKSIEVFSLNIAFTELMPDLALGNPTDQIKSYMGVTDAPHTNHLLYCMQHYLRCYQKIQKQMNKLDEDKLKALFRKERLGKFLGISYFKRYVCEGETLLFTQKNSDGYEFTYTEGDAMKSPYCSVRFCFSWKEGSFPIGTLLDNCVLYKLIYEYDIRILKYDSVAVTFAIRQEEQKQVYEAIHNLASLMATKEKNTPIVIDAENVSG